MSTLLAFERRSGTFLAWYSFDPVHFVDRGTSRGAGGHAAVVGVVHRVDVLGRAHRIRSRSGPPVPEMHPLAKRDLFGTDTALDYPQA